MLEWLILNGNTSGMFSRNVWGPGWGALLQNQWRVNIALPGERLNVERSARSAGMSCSAKTMLDPPFMLPNLWSLWKDREIVKMNSTGHCEFSTAAPNHCTCPNTCEAQQMHYHFRGVFTTSRLEHKQQLPKNRSTTGEVSFNSCMENTVSVSN